jgi:23S rRNA pseudouridine955/2504/2580 synthase/23S rRNA pseudouridine1911/1915/1917 synthase
MNESMERKPSAKVLANDSGRTVLDWLSSRFTYFSRQSWLAMLGEGRVKVDGIIAAADRTLRASETVAFSPPPIDEPPIDARCSIVFEDEDYLIVDKSANLPCHPGGRYFEHSLQRLLQTEYGELRIATRLDRETSGLVLACKSAESAAYIQSLQMGGGLEKTYLALVHGRFPGNLEAKGFLTVDTGSAVRKKRRFISGAERPEVDKREACWTSFDLVATVDAREPAPKSHFSLVKARPRTGRTHQIRASLLSLGYPIVGDKLYGLDEGCFLRFAEGLISEEDLSRLILPSQALHCAALYFRSSSGKAVTASSSPTWDLPFDLLLPQLP